MKTARAPFLSFLAVAVLGGTLVACGGADLKPELQAHVDRYERMIETFETKFAAVRGDSARYDEVSEAWVEDLQLWLEEFDKVAPTLSDEEGLAFKAQIDKLNRRAEKMIMGG